MVSAAAAPEAEGEPDADAAERAAHKAARKAAKRAARAAAAAAEEEGAAAAPEPPPRAPGGGVKRPRAEGGGGGGGGSPGRADFYVPCPALVATPSVGTEFRAAACISVEDDFAEGGGGGGDPWLPITTWAHLGSNFSPAQRSLVKAFEKPTPIQAQSWPIILSGRDMIGIASTGSGKTIAFLLPALVHIAAQPPLRGEPGGRGGGPVMLVLSPTRELAMQTATVAEAAGAACGVRSVTVYGGVPKGPQIAALSGRGGAPGTHIVVATPGRLKDLLQDAGTAVSLERVTFVVLDEADRMLDMGFIPDVRAILAAIPTPLAARHTVMFSATWPEEVRRIAGEFLHHPVRVVIGSASLAASHAVEQKVEVIEQPARDARLISLLRTYHGEKGRTNRIIVFVLYKKEADRVADFLTRQGWKNCAIHGDLSQDARTRAFHAFKAGTTPILVATDVAARGLDIPNVEVVINYSFPLTIEVGGFTLFSPLSFLHPPPPPPSTRLSPPPPPTPPNPAGLRAPHWTHRARRQDGARAHLFHAGGQGALWGARKRAPRGGRACSRGPGAKVWLHVRLQAAPPRLPPRVNERNQLSLARAGTYVSFARDYVTPPAPPRHPIDANPFCRVKKKEHALYGAHFNKAAGDKPMPAATKMSFDD